MPLYSELVTQIKADNRDFNKKVDESRSKASLFGKDLLKFGGIAATAIGVTAVAGFTSLLHLINETTDQISSLVDTANRLGGSVAGLQKLQYAAQLSGISAGELEGAMTRLSKAVISADSGSGKAAESLKTLGLSAKALSDLSIDEQYLEVAKAIGGISDKSKQAELAFNLFGKSGIKQLSLIRDGVNGAFDDFDKLGGSLTDEQAQAVDSYGDSIDRLKATFGVFAIQLTATVAPALEEFINWIQKSIVESGGLGEVGKQVGLYFIDGIVLAVKGFQALLDAIENIKISLMEARLTGLNFLQTFSKLGFAAGGGDFNFSRSDDIAKLTQDINSAMKQSGSGSATSGVLQGLNDARSAVDGSNASQKVEVIVRPAPEFIIQVSESNTINSAIRQALYKITGSESGSTMASGG